MDEAFRRARIADAGATGDEVRELLEYNHNHFDLGALDQGLTFPLADEPFVDCWRRWTEESRRYGAFAVLARHLPQLRFPIRRGMRQDPDYRAAVLKGQDPADLEGATGLSIGDPERVELALYRSLAGHVPLVIARGRDEFVALVRALGKHNEPVPVPESMGALALSGYNNWARIHRLRRQWQDQAPDRRRDATWAEAFARIRQDKSLFQDRLILLSDGPYSAVAAADLGLDDATWRQKSLLVRRDHECAHYFTRRLFGSMRNNLLDELIADYAGIVAAEGRYRADWFLRFIGLEDFPRYRQGGRLDIYRGDPALSDGAFRALHGLVKRAAEALERFDRQAFPGGERGPQDQARILAALASLRLDELAADDGDALLAGSVEEVRRRMG